MADEINTKQRRFAEEYMVDLNATQAAIRAGYSEKTAQQQGSRLLSNAVVAEAITELRKGLTDRTAITAARILEEYRRVAFASMPTYIEDTDGGFKMRPVGAMSEEDAAAICEVTHTVTAGNETVKVKLHNKLAALDALARHLGLDAPKKVDIGLPQEMDFGGVKIQF